MNEKKITLSEFIKNETAILTEFEREWLAGNRDTPTAYPAKLDYAGWVSFFNAFVYGKEDG